VRRQGTSRSYADRKTGTSGGFEWTSPRIPPGLPIRLFGLGPRPPRVGAIVEDPGSCIRRSKAVVSQAVGEAADQVDVIRSRVEVPPPAYVRSPLPGLEPIQDARDALARRFFEDHALSEDEYKRLVADLLEQEAVLRRERDNALADIEDQLADLHEWFVETTTQARLARYVTTDRVDQQRARAAHLLRLRRQLLELPTEDERRELYDREEGRSIEGLPAEYSRRSLAQITADLSRTERLHDAAVRYVATLIDEERSDLELLEAARQALAEVRQWERDQAELRELYDQVRALQAPEEFAVVEPVINRIESNEFAYVELPRRHIVEALRSKLRSVAVERDINLKTQVLETKPLFHLLVAPKGKDAELRRLANVLWRTRSSGCPGQ
jgi:hypothetical protein